MVLKYLFLFFDIIFFLNSRKQARIALKLKVQSAFEEAFDLQERLAQQHEEKMKQRALCEQLANQVEY
jgi:hypothetical protein